MSKTSSAKKSARSNGARAAKRTYERTTPVGRVLKHVGKALRIAVFAVDRMSGWEHGSDEDLALALGHAKSGTESLSEALRLVTKLYDAGWVPPKKSTATTFEEGEEVKIGDKHRAKYLQVYAATAIDNLVVTKCLPSGEIAVRHGTGSPFIVAKSHLEKRRTSSKLDGAAERASLEK